MSLAKPSHDAFALPAQALTGHAGAGGMILLVLGLSQQYRTASSTLGLVHWLCTAKPGPGPMQQSNLATLHQMNGLERLSDLLTDAEPTSTGNLLRLQLLLSSMVILCCCISVLHAHLRCFCNNFLMIVSCLVNIFKASG